MKHFIATLAAWLLLSPATFASGEWFILTDKTGWATSDVRHPVAKTLKEWAGKNVELKSVAFTPGGDWVVLVGQNGVYTSNVDLPAVKKLVELQKGNTLNCVAFSPGGGWVLYWGQNGNWTIGDTPEDAFKKTTSIAKDNGRFRSIAFAPGGGWVILFDDAGIWYSGVPGDLAKLLDQHAKKRVPVRCVSFTSAGDWFCLAEDGWWTSDVNLPAAKELSRLAAARRSLRWIAFAPEDPSKLRYFLDIKPAYQIKATLTTDIAHPNAKVDNWYFYAPDVPNLPGQRNVKTTFNLKNRVVHEASPLKRPLLFAQIDDGRKQVHLVVTIDATLMSRHLRPLAGGATPPMVKDLTPVQIEHFTRSTPTLDLGSAPLRQWINSGGLTRKENESEIAFATRVLASLRRRCSYEWPTPADTVAKVCTSGKSDCGGLSTLFMAVMRTNGIPARAIGGRWAYSQKPGKKDDGQWHVKSEFFARGVGWVPVDSSAAVTDKSSNDFSHIGNENGDFLAMANDLDLSVDSVISGRQNVSVIQGITYWWRGSGGDQGNRYEDFWTVQKEKAPAK
jgi:hypothetical protein